MIPLGSWAHATKSTCLVLIDSGCLVDAKMSETSEAWLQLKLTSMHVLVYLSGLGRIAGRASPPSFHNAASDSQLRKCTYM